MNGTSLLNRLWLKGECFTWEITTEGGHLNHSWPLRKWSFYAFALLAVQLFIRLFCLDCLRIKKEFKSFWSHFIHMDVRIVTSLFNFLELLRCSWYKVCLFFLIIGLVCCSAGKGLGLLHWVVVIALNFSASVCASVSLLLLSKEVKRGFCFISLVLHAACYQVQSNLSEFERAPA